MNWVGIDIGGANIKVADGNGFALSHVFSLWKHPERLAHEIRMVLADAPPADHVAATMTGELADCYATKAEGVRAILSALTEAVDNRHTRVYLADGQLVTPQVAARKPDQAGASNWHALARYAARMCGDAPGLLIDIGSTTTDIIPLERAVPAVRGRTDTERLRYGELLFSGVERSPLCAVVGEVPYRNDTLPIAQELFATMLDVYVILGELNENPTNTYTADGRPATKVHARARLARTICADSETFHHRDAVILARAAAEAQLARLHAQVQHVYQAGRERPKTVICSGKGEFLAQRLAKNMELDAEIISLSARLGPAVSACAPAHALAVLAREAYQS